VSSSGRAPETEELWELVEPNATGHHLWYVRLLSEHLLRCGRTPLLRTTTHAARSPQMRDQLGELTSDGRLRVVVDPALSSTTRGRLGALRRCLRRSSFVVVPDADRLLGLLVIARLATALHTPRLRLLVMRPPVIDARALLRGTWRPAIKSALMKLLRLLGVVVLELSSPVLSTGRPHACPDAIEPRVRMAQPAARAHLDLGDGAVCVCIGALSERKAISALLDCWSTWEESPRLLLVGTPDPETSRRLREPDVAALTDAGRVEIRTGWVDEYVFDIYLSAADLVLTLDTEAMSSGVLVRAEQLGVRALVGGSPLYEHMASAAALGFVAPDLTPLGLRASIVAALASPIPAGDASCPGLGAKERSRCDDFAATLTGVVEETRPTGQG
jgi:hypothetical protein